MSKAEPMSEMQKELLNRADSIMLWVQESVTKAGQFAAEQIPDIAMQYVAYGRAMSTFAVVIAIGLLFLSFALFKKAAKRGHASDAGFFSALGGVVSIIVGGIVLLINTSTVFMVWFAPKVWLLREVVNLVK
jgi:hypothetical protein